MAPESVREHMDKTGLLDNYRARYTGLLTPSTPGPGLSEIKALLRMAKDKERGLERRKVGFQSAPLSPAYLRRLEQSMRRWLAFQLVLDPKTQCTLHSYIRAPSTFFLYLSFLKVGPRCCRGRAGGAASSLRGGRHRPLACAPF